MPEHMPEPEFHDHLVNLLYDTAMAKAREQWPSASDNLTTRIALNALCSAKLRAEARAFYPQGDRP